MPVLLIRHNPIDGFDRVGDGAGLPPSEQVFVGDCQRVENYQHAYCRRGRCRAFTRSSAGRCSMNAI